MNWEAVAAISTAFTGLVIMATALAAVREVRIAGEHARATREQLEHLRNATQFEGALAIFKELDTPLQMDARHFVQFQLKERMQDKRFHDEVSRIAGADELAHKELAVLRCFERIGTYVRKGWVDPDTVYMVAAGRVIVTWHALHEVVAIHRAVAGDGFWKNFEQLYEGCKAWQRQQGFNAEALHHHQITKVT